MSNLKTEKIEAILTDVKEIIVVAKKVKEDGKVDVSDLGHIMLLLPKIPKFIEDFKAIGEAFEEGKDFDVAEVVSLIQKVHGLVKEIEAA